MIFVLAVTALIAAEAPPDDTLQSAPETLGQQLFHDTRFSNPRGDMETSCASCHMRSDPLGYRAFTEALSHSWHPWRNEDPSREALRNTPTLLDLADHPLIHFDGEFHSLEEQARKTLVGRNFGWLPSEKQTALDHIYAAIHAQDASQSYRERFLTDYTIDIDSLDRVQLVNAMGNAIADFVRSLRSEYTSAYDRFLTLNKIDPAPKPGEGPKGYGTRLLEEMAKNEEEGTLRLPEAFSPLALEGYKTFLRTTGRDQAGNCVACHVPPTFTDFTFHNAGVTQDIYDGAHGEGSFTALAIPSDPNTPRPMKKFLSISSRKRPGHVDLGHWNYAKFGASPLYRAQDSESAFLERTIATFKTPTLRNLAATDPYMHDGGYVTLEEALDLKIRAAFLARMGQLRNPDPELEHIHIFEDDIPALFAFLNALNDAGKRVAVPSKTPRSASGTLSSRYSP